MKDSVKPIFPWKLAVFPLLEVSFFIASLLVGNIFLSIALVLVAGVFLSFSIHVFFHECVHAKPAYSTPVNIINSLILGLPFDGYRVHHFNHHCYENSLKDFSTTWFLNNGIKTGFSYLRYSLGWVRQLQTAINEPEPFDEKFGSVKEIKQRIPIQKMAILFLLIALAFIGWKYVVLYLLLIYSGWAFSALHNYGQHPPIESEPICTYPNNTYNLLFYNNGLHSEHHKKPWLAWDSLELDNNSIKINKPHLINPFFTGEEND